MHAKIPLSSRLLLMLAFCSLVGRLGADVIETKDGARLVGKVGSIADGSVMLDTAYAGKITVKQAEVATLATDGPVSVRLTSGTRVQGRLTATASGLQIAATEGSVATTVGQVAALWTADGRDPELVVLDRKWAIEATVDAVGRTGTREQLGTAAGLRATLAGARDTLVFYTAYDRQVTDGTKSADQFKAGVDYSAKFTARNSWYVRSEGGFDRIKDIQFYNVTAAGVGHSFIENDRQKLTGRIGLSYRTENYRSPLNPDISSPGADVGIDHSLKFSNSSLVNRVTYMPSFDDFGNYRINHESFLEMPLTPARWKIRLGVNNDYNSRPAAGIERLDTGYFTRLVMTWK